MDQHQWRSLPSAQGQAQTPDWNSWPRQPTLPTAHSESSNPHLYPPRGIESGYSHGPTENVSSLPLPATSTGLGGQHYRPLNAFALAGTEHTSYTTNFTANQTSSTIGQSAVASTAPTSNKQTVRGKRKAAEEWRRHKQVMEDFYMKKDNSLEQLIEFMKTNFQFDATSKQYKSQFSTWGWHKHVTRDLSRALNDKHNRRMLEGKRGSKFTFRNQRMTVEAVQKHLGLTEEEKGKNEILNLPTPYGVTVETPGTIPSPATRPPERSQSKHDNSQVATTRAGSSLQPITLRWNGYTVQDLDRIRQMAYELADDDKIEHAETKFQELLDASKHLLPVTAEVSTGIGYEVACFLARHDEMEKADQVLDDLSAEFVQRWGSAHQNTLKHYAIVGKLLAQWDRHEDAVNVLKRITDDFSSNLVGSSRDDSYQAHAPASSSSPNYVDTNNILFRTSITAVADEHEGQTSNTSYTLSLLQERTNLERALELEDDDSTDRVIKRLLQRMEENPMKNATDIIRARSLLVTFYDKADMQPESKLALTDAKNSTLSLCKLEFDPKCKLSVDFFNTSIELARTLLNSEQPTEAEHLLDVLQERFTDEYGYSHTDTISLLTSIGKMYDNRKEWNLARPRFEAAYAGAIDRLGLGNPLVQRLEMCLEKERYSFTLDMDNDTSFLPIIGV